MVNKNQLRVLVSEIFNKGECFEKITYPDSYSFFLDLPHLRHVLDVCEEAKKKEAFVFSSDSTDRQSQERIVDDFDLAGHLSETVDNLWRLIDQPGCADGSLVDMVSSLRHSLALERLYRGVFYGCMVPLREYLEPVHKRSRKISKRLISEIVREEGINEYFSIVGSEKSDLVMKTVDDAFIDLVEMNLTNWGRHLDIRVSFHNCKMVPLSVFFGVLSEVYVHDDIEKKNSIVAVLRLIVCINNIVNSFDD